MTWRLTGRGLWLPPPDMPDSTMPSDPGTFTMRKEAYSSAIDYNALPDSVKQATDINMFKNNLDQYRGTPIRTGSRPTDYRLGRQNRNRGPS